MSNIEKVMEKHKMVVEDGYKEKSGLKFKSYAITTLRGGVGKSTLAFNLAFEMSDQRSLLVADLCPQCNLTETLMRDEDPEIKILDVLQPRMLGPAFGMEPPDPTYKISATCHAFKSRKPSFLIPGDPLMFAFPSTMYQQLQIAMAQNKPQAVKNLLESLGNALRDQMISIKAEGILMDTSPFYAGGTHLAWCAAEAVIIPVRVDEHSIASLELTLDLLSNTDRDFQSWNSRAGGRKTPKVAAIVMTMVGARSNTKSVSDRASIMYIERALEIAQKYPQLFNHSDPSDAFVITDDFVSAGRISGAKSIPISKLEVGSFHTVEGKRLQVNQSANRYQRELAYLVSVI